MLTPFLQVVGVLPRPPRPGSHLVRSLTVSSLSTLACVFARSSRFLNSSSVRKALVPRFLSVRAAYPPWRSPAKFPGCRGRPKASSAVSISCPNQSLFAPTQARRGLARREVVSFTGHLLKLPIEQFLRERYALEFLQLEVLLHSSIQRQADFPRSRKHCRIFDSGLIVKVVR